MYVCKEKYRVCKYMDIVTKEYNFVVYFIFL